ncbi:Gfo/Idh/MocA family oxidoreductase [Rhizobium sp. Leaf262]|uniref:Gfo/Idh/MocA family protein n=1 Tax=Rhizobium sp. Leaf262 TaxID=1736312 RepID=UPI00071457FE|nr:Gfo/Idh/MocA family oxidoreductase [Rhizobium sp. Leaf262]KQO76280.1 oxidoreductase [Rhizobium sp. Leaf262]
MIGIAVVGYGYWGPNLVRNIVGLEGLQLLYVCDLQKARLSNVKLRYPTVEITDDFEDILRDPRVHAVAIATPVSSHFMLATKAMMAGKHVFVEKPMAASSEEARRMVDEAARRNLILAVDHTFIHTGAVKKMRDIVSSGFGDIYYYDSVRVNLGLFQHDVSVVWDLAVHDLAIMDYVLPEKPIAVSGTGVCHIAGQPENIAYLTLFFESKLIAHIHVNWLAPVKIRRTLIGGSNKMIVYDDLEPSEKIKVYDKGITISDNPASENEPGYKHLVGYRIGDMHAPQLDMGEALGSELREFIRCVENNIQPTADGQAGLRVVQILEAAARSITQQGRVIELEKTRLIA